jgi:hypothetical protein
MITVFVVPPSNLISVVIAVTVFTVAPVTVTVIIAVVMFAMAMPMLVGDRHAG